MQLSVSLTWAKILEILPFHDCREQLPELYFSNTFIDLGLPRAATKNISLFSNNKFCNILPADRNYLGIAKQNLLCVQQRIFTARYCFLLIIKVVALTDKGFRHCRQGW
jgi:hypothetical protein